MTTNGKITSGGKEISVTDFLEKARQATNSTLLEDNKDRENTAKEWDWEIKNPNRFPKIVEITSSPKAMRYNTNKRKWSLVHFKSLEPMVEVLEYGAHKYSIFEDEIGKQFKGADISKEEAAKLKLVSSGANNWRVGEGIDPLEVLESMARHVTNMIDNYKKGTYIYDKESMLREIGHVQCNAMFFAFLEDKNNLAPQRA